MADPPPPKLATSFMVGPLSYVFGKYVTLLSLIFCLYDLWKMFVHSSEIWSSCLVKCPSKFSIFWNMKTFFLLWMPWDNGKKSSYMKWKTERKKLLLGFWYSKNVANFGAFLGGFKLGLTSYFWNVSCCSGDITCFCKHDWLLHVYFFLKFFGQIIFFFSTQFLLLFTLIN